MVRAATVGVNPRDAWRMTFRELTLYTRGVNEHRREAYRQLIAVSHLTESLRRTKRLPKLAELLPEGPNAENVEQRRARAKSVFEAFKRTAKKRGELIDKRKKK